MDYSKSLKRVIDVLAQRKYKIGLAMFWHLPLNPELLKGKHIDMGNFKSRFYILSLVPGELSFLHFR